MKFFAIIFLCYIATFSNTSLGAARSSHALEGEVAENWSGVVVSKKPVERDEKTEKNIFIGDTDSSVDVRQIKSIKDVSIDDLARVIHIDTPDIKFLNRRIDEVFIEDKMKTCGQVFTWISSFCLGWSTCAGTWNIWTVTGYEEIQKIPLAFSEYTSSTPVGIWAAMIFQTGHAFAFLIPVNMAAGHEMISDMLGHIRLNKNIAGTIINPEDTCSTATCKRLDYLSRYLKTSTKTTFLEKEGRAGSYKSWGNVLLSVYAAADSLPELGVLWENLIREKNYHTRIAVPGFFIQNYYERWRTGSKALRNTIAGLFPGENEKNEKELETITKRNIIIQLFENAAYNLRRMDASKVRSLHNKIWKAGVVSPREGSSSIQSTGFSLGDSKIVSSLSTTSPHLSAAAASVGDSKMSAPVDEEEGRLTAADAALATRFLALGNETVEIAEARIKGTETNWRVATRLTGYGIGLVGTWGTFEFVRRSLSLALQSFAGLDSETADVAGTVVGSLMGTTRALRNIKSASENYVAMFDSIWNRDHFKRTAEYDEFLRTDFSPWQSSALRIWTYVEAIYFSAPWYSVLLPVLSEMEEGPSILMLTSFFLAEPTFNANQYNIDLFSLFGEAHRMSLCGCRRHHKNELNRTKMLVAIDKLRDITKHLPDHIVKEFYDDMVFKNPMINDETRETVRKRVEEDYKKPSILDKIKIFCHCGDNSEPEDTSKPKIIQSPLFAARGNLTLVGGSLASAGGRPVGVDPIRSHSDESDNKTSSTLLDCICNLFSSRRR